MFANVHATPGAPRRCQRSADNKAEATSKIIKVSFLRTIRSSIGEPLRGRRVMAVREIEVIQHHQVGELGLIGSE